MLDKKTREPSMGGNEDPSTLNWEKAKPMLEELGLFGALVTHGTQTLEILWITIPLT